jgi:hypothetical protein
MDQTTYKNAMTTADWIFHRMLSHPGGLAKCYPAALFSDPEPPPHLFVKSYLNNGKAAPFRPHAQRSNAARGTRK